MTGDLGADRAGPIGGGSSDALTDEMAERLATVRGRTVGVYDLLAMLVDLRPSLAVDAERSARLAEVLRELEGRDLILPSKGRTQVHGVELPRSVLLLSTRPGRGRSENPALRFPWVPEMAWAATGPRRPPELHRKLCRLSEWIAANRGRRVVPERERSLEIFGGDGEDDDKALGRLLDGVLRDRAATVDALAVVRVHPPMAVARVEGAVGRTVLVVENGTPFHSAREAACAHAAAGVPVELGWIGYGVGEQLGAILPSLTDLGPTGLVYFGDLDPKGLRFAAAGARRCREIGLPPLRPACWLYRELLDRGHPQGKKSRAAWPEEGLAWLGTELARRLQQELGPGEWLAQEWVGIEALSADATWCTAEGVGTTT